MHFFVIFKTGTCICTLNHREFIKYKEMHEKEVY